MIGYVSAPYRTIAEATDLHCVTMKLAGTVEVTLVDNLSNYEALGGRLDNL